RVFAPAQGEAEGEVHLRPPRAPIPQPLREGVAQEGRHRREPPQVPRGPARQRRLPPRLRADAPPGPPARQPRARDGQRPRLHDPEPPAPPGRHRRDPAEEQEPPARPGGPRPEAPLVPPPRGGPHDPPRQVPRFPRARGHPGEHPRAAHRRALLEVSPAHPASPPRTRMNLTMTNTQLQMPDGVQVEEMNDTYGRFTVQPLERGYGVTIGNAFRRVMLSSLEGVAITAIKIDGVQ